MLILYANEFFLENFCCFFEYSKYYFYFCMLSEKTSLGWFLLKTCCIGALCFSLQIENLRIFHSERKERAQRLPRFRRGLHFIPLLRSWFSQDHQSARSGISSPRFCVCT